MRISCCISSLSGGGAEHLMSGLVERLAPRHDVQLVTLCDGERDDYPVGEHIERHALNLQRDSRNPIDALHGNLERVQQIRDALKRFEPDVALAFSDQMNVTALLAARQIKVPVVVTELTDPRYHALPQIWRWLRRWAYPRATAAVAVSQAAADTMQAWCKFPVHLIRPAVEKPEEITLASPATGERKRLSVVGRLSAEKRFDLLIRAFDRIADRHPDWTLEIAGSGPEGDYLQDEINATKCPDRIHLHGRIPSVWPYLAASHAFALTSRYEGTPVALLEAMAVGLPCIAIDSECGAAEILTPGVDGILTADDEAEFTAQLDRLLGEDALRTRLGKAAAKSALQFGWEPCVNRFEEVLAEAVAARHGRRPFLRR